MEKNNTTFYANIIKFKDSNILTKINKIIKENILLTPIIYIIGTIALLLRNKKYGLQFTSISLLQFAIMVAYIIFFLLIYTIIEYNYIKTFELIKTKENKKYIKLFGYILLFIIFVSIPLVVLYTLTNDLNTTLTTIFVYYIFWPLFTKILKKSDTITSIYTVFIFIYIIMNIPMQLGGLKGQEVKFHEYNSNEIKEYTYYGNYDSLYQFVSDDKVYLIPIESGYIEYTNFKGGN